MENRIVGLEKDLSYMKKEFNELKQMHKEEIAELKKTLKEFTNVVEGIKEEIRFFRQTHLQIKYFIIGGALIWIAKEVGITHFLKLLLGVL